MSEVVVVFPEGVSIRSGILMMEGLLILVPRVMEDMQEMMGFCGIRWAFI